MWLSLYCEICKCDQFHKLISKRNVVNKQDSIFQCIVCKNKRSFSRKYDILLIQGFFGSPNKLYNKFKVLENLGYNFLLLNRVNDNNWDNLLSSYQEIINNNSKPVIIIGESFGAVLSIFLSKNKKVKKIYALSAFNNDSILENNKMLKYLKRFKGAEITKESTKEFMINKQRKSRFNSEKITLIHGFNDKIVPFSHFKENIKFLNIPFERQITHQYGHQIPKEIINFIINEIKSYF